MKTKFNVGQSVLTNIGLTKIESIEIKKDKIIYNLETGHMRLENQLAKASKEGEKEIERQRLQEKLNWSRNAITREKLLITEHEKNATEIIKEMLKKGHRIIYS